MTHTTQVIMEVDVPNKNNHVYPRAVIENAIMVWKDKQMLGQVNMPVGNEQDWVDLNRASHVVENLRLDDNNCLIGDVTVLNTPRGQFLDDLMTVDGLCFRSCGIGRIHKDEKGHMVITDYQLLSINAVFDGA